MVHVRTIALALALAAAPAQAIAQESALAELRAAGRDTATLLRLGRALRRAGRFDEALRALRDVSRASPNYPEAQWEAARVRFDQGVFQPARAACMSFPAPRSNPREAFRNHVCLARAYLLWNRVALAEREITQARSVNPNDGELQLVIADSRRLASDLAGAEAAYRAAESALPGRAEPALGLGQLYEMFQRLDQAQQQYARALEVDAADPMASLHLGRFLLRRRTLPAEALPHLRRAVENRPAWAEALAVYGDALLATGAHADAMRVYEEVARLSPTQPGVQSGFGRALVAMGRWADAEAPLRTAIRQVDTDVTARMALAEVLEHTQREPEAMREWDAVIDRSPGNTVPHLRAAALAHRTHQNALARAYLDRLLTDDAALAPALYLRGVVAMDDNDRSGARQYLTQALQGHGEVDREDVQRRLQELDAPPRTRRR